MRENMWDHEQFEEKLCDTDYLIRIGDEYIDRLKDMNSIDFQRIAIRSYKSVRVSE